VETSRFFYFLDTDGQMNRPQPRVDEYLWLSIGASFRDVILLL